MRIIRGKYKGRRIIPPKNFKARPTTDFAKEGLFNMLENRLSLDELTVLDLFSGTGNIAYEFLSAGCTNVTIVDINKSYIRHAKQYAEDLFPGQLRAISADSFSFCKKKSLDFDIVFADPPFKRSDIDNLPDIVLNNPSFKETALFILEHPKNFDFSAHPFFIEHRKYGNIIFSFFQKQIND